MCVLNKRAQIVHLGLACEIRKSFSFEKFIALVFYVLVALESCHAFLFTIFKIGFSEFDSELIKI